MPIYQYQCNKCNKLIDKFFAMKDRQQMIKCDSCGGNAHRIFTTGAGYVKKQRVGDIWDKQGAEPVNENDPDSPTRKASRERIRNMREKNKER